jgi:hypothetical protein
MIPNNILLPTLSAKDYAEFAKLCADYAKAQAQITAHNGAARIARKRELRDKLKTAPADQLLSIGAELETLESAYQQAKSGAKAQLKGLSGRYGELLSRLLFDCEKHTDEMTARAVRDWAKHFESFSAAPIGVSPVVQFLQTWKQGLADKRRHLDLIVNSGMAPASPTTLLPYFIKH